MIQMSEVTLEIPSGGLKGHSSLELRASVDSDLLVGVVFLFLKGIDGDDEAVLHMHEEDARNLGSQLQEAANKLSAMFGTSLDS